MTAVAPRPAKRVLLVGAGHANLALLRQADRLREAGADLVLVNADEYWYYAGMAGGVISGRYGTPDFRVSIRRLAEKHRVTFICDEVVSLLPDHRRVLTADNRSLTYDLAVFAVGTRPREGESEVPVDGSFPLRPIRNVLEIRNEVETLVELPNGRELALVILGAGAGGVEAAFHLAALLRARAPEAGWAITLLEARERLLPGFPAAASRAAWTRLTAAGVVVRCGAEVQHVQSGRVVLERGETLDFDLAVVSLGGRVGGLFSQAGLLTDADGAVLVDATLRVRDYPEIFAAGDCARLWGRPPARGGAHAVSQAPVLAANLRAALGGGRLRRYNRRRPFLNILSLGGEEGLGVWGRATLTGRWLSRLKHRLDQGYVRRMRGNG